MTPDVAIDDNTAMIIIVMGAIVMGPTVFLVLAVLIGRRGKGDDEQ